MQIEVGRQPRMVVAILSEMSQGRWKARLGTPHLSYTEDLHDYVVLQICSLFFLKERLESL